MSTIFITVPQILNSVPAIVLLPTMVVVVIVYGWLNAALQSAIKKASAPKATLSKEDERYM